MKDPRKKEIQLIHIARQQLGWDEDFYRGILWSLGQVRSSTDLSAEGRKKVLAHMKACGFRVEHKKKFVGPRKGVVPSRADMMHKVAALLGTAGRDYAYADAIAKRMYKVDKVEWLSDEKLHKLIGVLSIEARRNGRDPDVLR